MSSPESLIPQVYTELLRVAGRYLRRERAVSVQATELVHETYLRLLNDRGAQFQNRAHFVAIAAICMRRLLVERARARGADKRGGGRERVPLDDAMVRQDGLSIDVIALDAALTRLAEIDPVKVQVVELRFFGGLDVQETAAALDVSAATVKRHWAFAKAWLLRELEGDVVRA